MVAKKPIKIQTANVVVKPKPSYAPVYAAALYPQLATIARGHGYALAVHGSLQRDFDLIAIPWILLPDMPETVIQDITDNFAIRVIGEPEQKEHGRKAWTLSIGHGECSIDLSFMPLSYKIGVTMKIKCSKCGNEYDACEMIKSENGEICLDCAGYAPPTY